MNNILQSLKSDARFIISIPEFQSFLRELVDDYNRHYAYGGSLKFPNNPNDWLLTQLEYSLGLSNYESLESTREYNDENYYISYQYSILLRLGDIESKIKFNEYETPEGSTHESAVLNYLLEWLFSDADSSRLIENLKLRNLSTEFLIEKGLAIEISCIICYAIYLFLEYR